MTSPNDARLPLRLPSKTHTRLRYISRALGQSMNDIVLGAAETKIEEILSDPEVKAKVRDFIIEEREVLDTMAEEEPEKKAPPKKKSAPKKATRKKRVTTKS